MKVCFWGVRGSIPAPILSSEIKAKISTIVEQMRPEDIVDAESRRHFLDGLPPWLFGTVGGNTPCVSVELDGIDDLIVFDCGSGIRELGIACSKKEPKPTYYHFFLSHHHWDHVLGFPFFNPAYDPSVSMDFYWPKPGLAEFYSKIMQDPYFPVKLENMASKKSFKMPENPMSVGPATVSYHKLNHPGDSFAYLLTHNDKKFIYATDVELSTGDFLPTAENQRFFKDADLIVIDCQYTLGEAIEKYNWGHSAFSLAVDFAANWGIKHMVMFHHDPTYDDHKLHGLLQSARWYIQRMDIKGLEVSLAVEGLEIVL